MSPEQATAAWLRELRRVAPDADAALLLWFAEQLAGNIGTGGLMDLAGHLVTIARVLVEEAEASPAPTAQVIPLRRPGRPRSDDFPPTAA